MPQISEAELEARRRLWRDLPLYAERCLKIRTKAGGLAPFVFNRQQHRAHAWLEDHKARNGGRVRALVLKGRQMGFSTYAGARIFHQVTHRKGVRAVIMAHRADATAALFTMVNRFHTHLPDALKPETDQSSATALRFPLRDSGYSVVTAGTTNSETTGSAGRSWTVQLMHGSEVAFWGSDQVLTGMLQAVPELPNTEVLLESTANGMRGLFHQMCQLAMSGKSDFELLFMPWHEHDEYRREPPTGWVPPEKWREYRDAHGLDAGQVFWAWRKNSGLLADTVAGAAADPDDGPGWKFRQEYPATPLEAFQTSGGDGLIKSEWVLMARRTRLPPPPSDTPIIIGVDTSYGGDWSWVLDRQGRAFGRHVNERRRESDTTVIAEWVATLIERIGPDLVNIDAGANGSPVRDILVRRGYGDLVRTVQFGGKPSDERRFKNKRAEMWGLLAEAIGDPDGAELPDDDVLMQHLCAPRATEVDGVLKLEPKEAIIARCGFSPDGGDAAALTFASPVRRRRGAARSAPRSADQPPYNPLTW